MVHIIINNFFTSSSMIISEIIIFIRGIIKKIKSIFTMNSKYLFISNKRSLPYTCNSKTNNNLFESGLSNSIKFIVQMLKERGYKAEYVQVIDGNDIDREVYKYKPTVVILEAIWVTPAKIKELSKLHPKVKWVIRTHSEIPFLANEGIAIDWLFEYSKLPKTYISTNSNRIAEDLAKITKDRIFYLPNYYIGDVNYKKPIKCNNTIDIGCFGAIRPMKNQLLQAFAAIEFADEIGKHLKFHININREETGGNSVLKNIRSLFKNVNHELIEHPWSSHENFNKIIASMDMGMQVSFSETFNIVTADMVMNRIPVVVSPEIRWLHKAIQANPNSTKEVIEKLKYVYENRFNHFMLDKNIRKLKEYNMESIEAWEKFLHIIR